MRWSAESGSIVVSLLILMPLFAAILALSAAVHLTIRTDAKMRHVCRVQLLQSQLKAARSLTELLALNPRAKILRRERDIAEKLWRAAPTPEAKAVALVRLTMVISKQLTFAARQKALVAEGEVESRTGPSRASREVSASLVEDQTLYRSSALRSSLRASPELAAFDVVASPIGSLAPDYNPSPIFEKRQTMRIRWQVALGPLLPEWFDGLLFQNFDRLKIKAECAATMRKEKSKWSPVLSAANP